jgi:hypothetical protein
MARAMSLSSSFFAAEVTFSFRNPLIREEGRSQANRVVRLTASSQIVSRTGSQSQLEKDRQFNSWIDICFALYGARENDNSEIGCLSED